ncbi:MAG: MBL fold metallo-hydrolase [Candidatus Bipolaricaulota bacterium]|nr:MBL fold metallo-hydrolase [Candidatus Bipolaricaulota bacterium]MDW8151928.1 MBL fold metallo-hydrolase [Candidatus Bipolaricaulota bacterium]
MGWIKFLGTAGARFVVARQLRSSAGTWLELSGTQLLLDPGPGTLLRCRKARPPLEPLELSGIILSHKHLDHSTDVNIMIEAMADGGYKRRGVLLAPHDALEGEDPVVLRYVRPFLERIEAFQDGKAHTVGGVRITPVRHRHGQVETYGVIVEGAEGRIGFVVDTKFFPELPERYAGCQLLVLNTVLREWNPDIDHLSLPEALEIVKAVRPKLAVLTHFGMTMLRGKPKELAAEATAKLGLRVVAAEDGMTLEAKDWA